MPSRSRAITTRPLSRSTMHHGEHAEQPLREGLAPLGVGLHDDLGVALAEEAVALGLELGAQLPVVVDHPVEHGGEAELGVDHRLLRALRQVDDLEPAVAEGDPAGAPRRPRRPARGPTSSPSSGPPPRRRGCRRRAGPPRRCRTRCSCVSPGPRGKPGRLLRVRYFYDCEFGVTAPEVDAGLDRRRRRGRPRPTTPCLDDWDPLEVHPWVRENVLPQLPPASTWRSRAVSPRRAAGLPRRRPGAVGLVRRVRPRGAVPAVGRDAGAAPGAAALHPRRPAALGAPRPAGAAQAGVRAARRARRRPARARCAGRRCRRRPTGSGSPSEASSSRRHGCSAGPRPVDRRPHLNRGGGRAAASLGARDRPTRWTPRGAVPARQTPAESAGDTVLLGRGTWRDARPPSPRAPPAGAAPDLDGSK